MTSRPILVVDDDEGTREALTEFLQVNGYTVRSAENGQAALDEITRRHRIPALILLDVAMPVMDGPTFIGRARQESEVKDVPIIVITAHPSAKAAGANAILSKPVRPERLLSLVGSFLQPGAE